MEESRTPMLWGGEQDRELLEYYRSLVFWRNRWGVHAMSPYLIHAGRDGLLLFRVGSWLVVINRNNDEHDIDIGTPGLMWLALATANDVQLHGSILKVPPMSGAILAAESLM